MTRSRFLILLFSAFALLFSTSASAAETEKSFVRTKQTQLKAALKAKQTARLDDLFDQMLDYESIGREALGSHWEERSEEERAKFMGLLKQLVRRAYRRDLEKTLDYKVKFRGVSDGKGGTVVKTLAKHRTNKRRDPVSIDYLVHKRGSSFAVKDIKTEGSSMVRNYRSQFRRIIRTKGWDELINRMQAKADKG